MNLFNRRELIPVFSMKRLYDVQAALDAAGIPYHTKHAAPLGRSGGRGRANIFQDPDAAHDFRIFVHRDDYDRALAAIQPALRRN